MRGDSMAMIDIDLSGIEDLRNLMEAHPQQAHASFKDTNKRTASKVSKRIGLEIKKEYAVKITNGTINTKHVKVHNQNLKAWIEVKSRRLSIEENFKYSPKELKRTQKTGKLTARSKKPVTVTIKKKEPNKESRDLFLMKQRKDGSFALMSKAMDSGNYKFGFSRTLSIPQMVENEDVYKEITDFANDFWIKRFEHDFQYRIDKLR